MMDLLEELDFRLGAGRDLRTARLLLLVLGALVTAAAASLGASSFSCIGTVNSGAMY